MRRVTPSTIDIFDMRGLEGQMSNSTEAAGPGFASREEAHDEAVNRYPDVIRIAAGLAANSEWFRAVSIGQQRPISNVLASDALAIVIACERVCRIGGDE